MKKAATGSRAGSSVGRQAQSTGAGAADAARLRQQLVHARAEIADLQEELQEKNNLYLNAIKERDAGAEKLNNAKESLNRFEALVKQQVDRAMDKERKLHLQVVREKADLEQRLKLVQEEKNTGQASVNRLEADLSRLRADVGLDGKGAGTKDSAKRIEDLRAALDKRDKELDETKKHVNYLQDSIEDFMAENKVLRDMAGVPANYGIDREKVKLMDRAKIDDFTKLIRVLQEDNYRLEEERAKLKHMLKQQSMMYSCKTPTDRHKQFNLTPDQVARVDEFVWKLANGQASEPADFYKLRKENEKLKAQMEALNDKGFDFIKGQLEGLLSGVTGAGAGGLTQEQFAQIRTDNEELKALLQGHAAGLTLAGPGIGSARGGSGTLTKGSVASQGGFGAPLPYHPRVQPPAPRLNPDQSITLGYSHKWGADLAVTGKNGEDRGIDANDAYDNAFLQL